MVRLYARLMTTPAFSTAKLDGVGLYLILLMWTRSYEQNGRVPKVVAEALQREHSSEAPRRRILGRLIASGLLVVDGEDYRITDYESLNETSGQLKGIRLREAARARASRLRPSVIERDGLVCHICGDEVAPDQVHVDHVIALSKGGPSDPENLRVAHARCNMRKGAS